jgi:hypothetical protein
MSNGVNFVYRACGVPPGGPGTKELMSADVIVFATGFERPDLRLLPKVVLEQLYAPLAWYLQTPLHHFPRICTINSMYINALGTVGHVHIGIYTRMLLMFCTDLKTTPSANEMKR